MGTENSRSESRRDLGSPDNGTQKRSMPKRSMQDSMHPPLDVENSL